MYHDVSITQALPAPRFTVAYLRRILLATCWLLGACLVTSMAAASYAPPTVIAVEVATPGGLAGFSLLPNQQYSFDATISFPGAYLVKSDLYFGLMTPGGAAIYSWVKDGDDVVLSKALVPVVKDIDMLQARTLTLSQILQRKFEYRLTGAEAPGMYMVFALLTTAGSDPGNSNNWMNIEMRPVFIQAQ